MILNALLCLRLDDFEYDYECRKQAFQVCEIRSFTTVLSIESRSKLGKVRSQNRKTERKSGGLLELEWKAKYQEI